MSTSNPDKPSRRTSSTRSIKKSRQGRPRKSDETLRSIKLQVYLSDQEYGELKSILHLSGHEALSPFVRDMISRNGAIPIVDPKLFVKQMLGYKNSLDKIGVNINQISKSLNQAGREGRVVNEGILEVLAGWLEVYEKLNLRLLGYFQLLNKKILKP